ncbi:unnamed protein product [Notodromas monacha]|uniref:Transcription initiation factor TFIID component TAF4 C-terminal domain-containing protein n=1 Tax=Notodromas monacha TaxID=399045 RepID=A0A7R9BYN4_9CRUS|nr:unnamed protein product [Notodromas monacha]CAG0923811.1 unnamed protein product [Notodromas monacha]
MPEEEIQILLHLYGTDVKRRKRDDQVTCDVAIPDEPVVESHPRNDDGAPRESVIDMTEVTNPVMEADTDARICANLEAASDSLNMEDLLARLNPDFVPETSDSLNMEDLLARLNPDFVPETSPRQDGRILPEHARRNGSLCGSSSCWDIFREQVTEFMLLEAKKIHKKVSTVEIKGSAAEKVMITVRERFRHIIRSAAEFAEHRTDVFRNDSQFERILNVRAQIRFLKDSEEAQTELKAQMKKQRIISAAKSRTKKTDEQRAHMKQLVKSIQVDKS